MKLDAHWVPPEPGHSLYIRPTLSKMTYLSMPLRLLIVLFKVGTQKAIGVTPPNEALLFVICSPVGPYYPKGFKPISLYGTTEYVRATPGGTGSYKLGANYAPGVLPQQEAASIGYDQNLWLHGPDHLLTEVCSLLIKTFSS